MSSIGLIIIQTLGRMSPLMSFVLLSTLLIQGCSNQIQDNQDSLELGFITPPRNARPQAFYYWINGNITKKGILGDLIAFQQAGISGMHLFNASLYMPKGPVKYGSDQWYDLLLYTSKIADSLQLDLIIHNCAGWATSGGPWITPEKSMKSIIWSELSISGPHTFEGKLDQGETLHKYYRDIAVLAIPEEPHEKVWQYFQPSQVIADINLEQSNRLVDNNMQTSEIFVQTDPGDHHWIQLTFNKPLQARLITLHTPTIASRVTFDGAIEISTDGKNFKQIRKFHYYGRIPPFFTIPFQTVTASHFRIRFSVHSIEGAVNLKFSEVQVSNARRIENWYPKVGKIQTTLNRSVFPFEMQDSLAIPRDKIINLTENMNSDGELSWQVPPGNWTILRFGYTATGSTNHPSPKEGHGLEVDKMDPDAVAFQFHQALDKIIELKDSLGSNEPSGILIDSYEAGPQTWTDRFAKEFQLRRKYDMSSFLPVLTGRVVESLAISEGFLYDYRKTIADLIAESYYGTFQRLAHQHDLQLIAEPYGGIFNQAQNAEYLDVVVSEFWIKRPQNNNVKEIASIVHTSGKKIIGAESFTAKPEHGAWRNHPLTLKSLGDLAFTQGLNRVMLHSYLHQPRSEFAPGWTHGRYGTHFNRLNTWWEYVNPWISYLSRSQYLLQQGLPVTDICLLDSDDLDELVEANYPEIPKGYDYDICSRNRILQMKHHKKSLILQNGQEYKILVLPEYNFMSLPVLRHLHKLVEDGAVVVGLPPALPPGLQEYVYKQTEFIRLVDDLWGKMNIKSKMPNHFGEGKVYWNGSLNDILKENLIHPDFVYQSHTMDADIRYIHRTLEESEIYFLSNQDSQSVTITADFRIASKQPEFWKSDQGTIEACLIFRTQNDRIQMPVRLDPYGSVFIVFRKPLPEKWVTSVVNLTDDIMSDSSNVVEDSFLPEELEFSGMSVMLNSPTSCQLTYSNGDQRDFTIDPPASDLVLDDSWKVKFPDGWGAPTSIVFDSLISWSDHPDEGIRYFSGTATYQNGLPIPSGYIQSDQAYFLDLGEIYDIAEVWMNHKKVGIVWKPPFRLEITKFLKEGTNDLEIKIANRWVNRLIGDEHIPVEYSYDMGGSVFTKGALKDLPPWYYNEKVLKPPKRYTFTSWKHYEANSPLLPAGLMGPVKIKVFKVVSLKSAIREISDGK